MICGNNGKLISTGRLYNDSMLCNVILPPPLFLSLSLEVEIFPLISDICHFLKHNFTCLIILNKGVNEKQ